jgi:hypothetical protein
MSQTASLHVGETVLALPIGEATEGPPAVDGRIALYVPLAER